ncbi:MAG: N-succinyl-L,L-diaminopimelate desuccinylase, partial [uncultured Solirubrobacteraceae bacterium]
GESRPGRRTARRPDARAHRHRLRVARRGGARRTRARRPDRRRRRGGRSRRRLHPRRASVGSRPARGPSGHRPRPGQPARNARCQAGSRAGRQRHEGGARGDDRAGARRRRLSLPVLRPRGAAGGRLGAGSPAGARARGARLRPRPDDGAHRQRDPRGLSGQHQRHLDLPWPLGPLRAALDGRQRDRARGGGHHRAVGARARGARLRRPAFRRGGVGHHHPRGNRRQRDPRPGRVLAQLPLRPGPRCRFRRRPSAGVDRRPRRAGGLLQRAVRAGGHAQSAGPLADRARRAHRRAQAGVDAGGGVRRARARGGQLRPRRAGPGPPPGRVDRDRRPAEVLRAPARVAAV